ncbi:MAG: hypothetical protein DDT40_01147 [candidate division WS2 bacterium]|nr:hypothetical protein [Candidatus Psychracetigena formicireducens]
MKGLILNEIAQLLFSWKWWPLILIAFLIGWHNTEGIIAQAFNHRVDVNIWDAYLVAMNNWIDPGFLLMLAIAFATSDIVTKDYLTNYHWLVLSRKPNRLKWWSAKLFLVFAVTLVAIVATLGFSILWGLIRGIPFSSSPSSFAMGITAVRGGFYQAFPPFPPLTPDTNVLGLVAGITLYSSLTFGVIMSLFILASLFFAKPFFIVGLVFFWSLLEFTLTQYVLFWQRYLSLAARTFLMAHSPIINESVFNPLFHPPLWSSSTVFIIIGIGTWLWGWRRIKQTDF